MENINEQIDRLRYSKRRDRTPDPAPLTVADIRRCRWALLLQTEIEAFEKWQHAPNPEDLALETRVLQKTASMLTNEMIDEVKKSQ